MNGTTPIAIALGMLLLLSVGVQIAHAATCKDYVTEIVKTTTEDMLRAAIAKNPELKDASQQALVMTAGKIFLEAPRPDFQAYGWMMLLWYGGPEGQELVKQSLPKIDTEEGRAHFYFVMGLYQIGSATPDVAATGRHTIEQMRDSGKVSFVPDEMWTELVDGCELAQ